MVETVAIFFVGLQRQLPISSRNKALAGFFPILGPEGISRGGLQVLPQLAGPATTSWNFLVQRASFSRSGSQPQLVQIKKMSAPIRRFFAQLALVVFSVAIPEVSRGSVRGSLRLRHPVADMREGRSV